MSKWTLICSKTILSIGIMNFISQSVSILLKIYWRLDWTGKIMSDQVQILYCLFHLTDSVALFLLLLSTFIYCRVSLGDRKHLWNKMYYNLLLLPEIHSALQRWLFVILDLGLLLFSIIRENVCSRMYKCDVCWAK